MTFKFTPTDAEHAARIAESFRSDGICKPTQSLCDSCGKLTLTLATIPLNSRLRLHLCERCLSSALDEMRGSNENYGLKEISPLSFTKETATEALEAARAALAYVALRECEQLVGDIVWGGSFLDNRVEERLKEIALAWEKRNDLVHVARRAAASPYDDVSALVAEANAILARTDFHADSCAARRIEKVFAPVREARARKAAVADADAALKKLTALRESLSAEQAASILQSEGQLAKDGRLFYQDTDSVRSETEWADLEEALARKNESAYKPIWKPITREVSLQSQLVGLQAYRNHLLNYAQYGKIFRSGQVVWSHSGELCGDAEGDAAHFKKVTETVASIDKNIAEVEAKIASDTKHVPKKDIGEPRVEKLLDLGFFTRAVTKALLPTDYADLRSLTIVDEACLLQLMQTPRAYLAEAVLSALSDMRSAMRSRALQTKGEIK